MIPGRPTAGYLTVHNDGDVDDAIVGVTSPAAGVVELHETTTAADGTMGMGPVLEIPIPAHGEAVLEPGGYHLMIPEPTAPLASGDTVEVTLTFAAADPVTISVPVEAGAPMDEMDHSEY
jgi:copper(I)-binding protein